MLTLLKSFGIMLVFQDYIPYQGHGRIIHHGADLKMNIMHGLDQEVGLLHGLVGLCGLGNHLQSVKLFCIHMVIFLLLIGH